MWSSCAPAATRRPRPSPGPGPSTTTTSAPTPSTRSTGPSSTTWWPRPPPGPVPRGLRRARVADGGRAHGGPAPASTRGDRRAGRPWWSTRRSPSSTWPSPGWGSTRWRPGCGWSTASASPSRPPASGARCWWPSAGAAGAVRHQAVGRRPRPSDPVTVLHHLGLADEQVLEVAWDDLDRSFDPDHLTSLWIPRLAAPVAAELVRLGRAGPHPAGAVPVGPRADPRLAGPPPARGVLRGAGGHRRAGRGRRRRRSARSGRPRRDRQTDRGARRWPTSKRSSATCSSRSTSTPPWPPRRGGSPWPTWPGASTTSWCPAIPTCSVTSRPTPPRRWPTNWEALKKAEKGRSSVTEGIPAALPALALAAKLQRKAAGRRHGPARRGRRGGPGGRAVPASRSGSERADAGDRSGRRVADGEGGRPDHADEVGELLFALVNVARALGVDPETALRARAARFRAVGRGAGLTARRRSPVMARRDRSREFPGPDGPGW